MTDLTQYSDDQLAQMAGSAVSPAILGQESGNNPNVPASIDGAVGEGQILPATFAQYAKPGEDINNPADNLAVHNRIVADLAQKTNGDPARMAVGYFSGPGNIAPPDSPTPWKVDHKDGNGKSVSSYVSDILGRLNPVPAAQAQEHSIDLSQYTDDDLAKLAGTHAPGVQTPSVAPQGQPVDSAPVSTFGGRFLKNTGEAAKAAATQTGEAESEPMLSSPKEPGWLKPIDAAIRSVGKAGNAIGGTFGFLTSPAVGGFSAGVEPYIPDEVNAIKSLTGLNGDLTPEQMHEQAMQQGGNLTNAALLALGGTKRGEITTQAPPIVQGGNVSFLKSESSGSPMPKLSLAVNNSDNIFKNNQSGGTPSFLKPQIPLPSGLKTTDSGQPLLVTPADIKQGQADILPFLESDHIDLNKVADDLEAARKVNPHMTALDVMAKDEGGIPAGSNMIGLAKSIAQSPGQGRTMAAEMTGRGYSASQRIGDAFNQAISSSPYYKVQNDAIQKMEGSGELYQKAYAANQNVSSPVINRLLKTDAGGEALRYAANRMNTKMSLMGVPDPELAEQAKLAGQYQSGGISSGLKLQTMQYVKEGYDNQISRAFNAGEKGKAGDLIEQKNGLLGELDKIDQQTTGGAYAQARQTYSTGAKIQEAQEAGRNFMNMDAEEIQDFIKDPGRSNPEKVAFASGVRRALQDKMDNQSETTNPINQLWKPTLKKRLQPLFPDKPSFDNFARSMEHEKTMSRVDKIVQGSPTFQNQQFAKAPQSTMAGKLLRGAGNVMEPGMYISKLGDFVDKALADQAKTMSQNSKTVIMRYLTTKDPSVLRDLAARTAKQTPKAATK